MLDYLSQPLARISDDIVARHVSSEELVVSLIERVSSELYTLNAVSELAVDSALSAARVADQVLATRGPVGPLHGVPMSIKDSFDTAGVVTTAGTVGRAHYVPTANAVVVRRLLAAGAVLLAKTNTPELTLAYETDNDVVGRTNNPHDLTRTPGGSSGGAAALVAACGSVFDVGSDTAGSVRLPAHFCGVSALKPTSGLVPLGGHVIDEDCGVLGELTSIGPIARYVGDLGILLEVMSAGRSCLDATPVSVDGLRVMLCLSNGIQEPEPDVREAVLRCGRVLEGRGTSLIMQTLTFFSGAHGLFSRLIRSDGGAVVRALLRESGTGTPHKFLAWARRGGEVADEDALNELHRDWTTLRRSVQVFFDSYDVLVLPVHYRAAPLHGGASAESCTYLTAFNLSGNPSAVVRVGTTANGLPIGVQVVAARGADSLALDVAEILEQALGGWRPVVSPQPPASG